MRKTALSPFVGDAITYGVGGAGLGTLLSALTAAYPKAVDDSGAPPSVNKVVPKHVIPQPVFVDEDMAKRLAAKGVVVHNPPNPPSPLGRGEESGIDPMQKIAGDAPALDDVPGQVLSGMQKLAPWGIGLGALSGSYYGVNKLLAARAKQQSKDKYINKRKQLNTLLASMNTAGEGDLSKVASIGDLMPWLVGVPFVAGGALSFGDGRDAAVASNPNIKAIADLDKFYADQQDSPKIQLTPVLRPKPKKVTKSLPAPALDKVAGFRMPNLSKAMTEVGKGNDILSAAGGLAAIPAAVGLSSNIDDPTYKWAERGMMPLGVAALLNRRVMGHTPVSTALKGGAAGELGLFGGLRVLDNSAQAAKASAAQAQAAREVASTNAATADKALKYGLGGIGGIGALGLGGMAIANRQQSREATRARRAQSRQLKNILSTVQGHRVPGDIDGDGDGDVDAADREALAATAGVAAKPITGRRHVE